MISKLGNLMDYVSSILHYNIDNKLWDNTKRNILSIFRQNINS